MYQASPKTKNTYNQVLTYEAKHTFQWSREQQHAPVAGGHYGVQVWSQPGDRTSTTGLTCRAWRPQPEAGASERFDRTRKQPACRQG